MTNAVNRITAVDDTANSKINNTTLATTENLSANSQTAPNTAPSYSDDVSYSVVYIKESPAGYDEMKDILNKCITSYQDMAGYVENLKGKNEHLFVQMNAKSAEIADLSTGDGTGSGMQSAYSLDFQDEKTDKKDNTKADNKGANKAANRQEIQTKIDTKQSEVEDLKNTASQNSDELNYVKQDMDTNQGTIDKVMEKIGEDTSHINGMMRYVNAGAVGGGAAGLDPVSSTVASFFGFSSIFGGGKAKKRAEVKQLGVEAYRAEREVTRALQQCSSTLKRSESLSDNASNKLKEKQLLIKAN